VILDQKLQFAPNRALYIVPLILNQSARLMMMTKNALKTTRTNILGLQK
jgi:hypothetical protein